MTEPARTPHLLIVRDGWGTNPNPEHDDFNAVLDANTPVADRLMDEWPTTLVATSGEDVGLPDGTMGNSEVGHQNIGAGRIVFQDSVRITKAVRDGTLGDVEPLQHAIEHAKEAGTSVHLMGINSDAGVHGLLDHLEGLVKLCKDNGQEKVFIHLFSDGRDTGPFTGKAYAAQVEAFCREIGVGKVATVCGRYYAMDRDNRWERVARAYAALTGNPEVDFDRFYTSVADAFQSYYDNPDGPGAGDEFIPPSVIAESEVDVYESRISDGDSVIYFNYRGDRPRELCSAFLLPEFQSAEELTPSPDTGERGFDRGDKLKLEFVLMTPYSERLAGLAPVAFPKPPKMVNTLGEFISAQGLTQFRCAETEKFPHVTFFFNDYRDDPFKGENRSIIQSPKVATYDLQPEMSARGVADAVLARLNADDTEDLIVVNFANGDMVGHTGSMDAATKACETVDALVGELVDKALAAGGTCIVTADHGNAEQMWSPENDSPHTAHTIFTVPLIVVGEAYRGKKLRSGGRLADIAPTCLEMMGIKPPAEMEGKSLI